MKMTNKGKAVIIIAVLLIVVGWTLFTVFGGKGKSEALPTNVEISAPDGESAKLTESKRSAYEQYTGNRRGNVDEYFDSLGSESNSSDVLSEVETPPSSARNSRPTEVLSPTAGGGASSQGAVNSQQVYNDILKASEGSSNPESVNTSTSSPKQKGSASSSKGASSSSPKGSSSGLTYAEQRKLDSLRVEDFKRMHAQATGVAEQPQEQEQTPSRLEVTSAGGSLGGDSIINCLDDDTDLIEIGETDRPVRCMFVRDEKIESGQRVMIRILEPLRLETISIPENTHLSAISSLSDRLNLVVNSVEINGRIYPINYDAYDYDGALGIYCPQSSKQSTARQAASQGTSIGQSLIGGAMSGVGMQVVSSGVSLVTQRNGRTQINITAGYTFYLAKRKK